MNEEGERDQGGMNGEGERGMKKGERGGGGRKETIRKCCGQGKFEKKGRW